MKKRFYLDVLERVLWTTVQAFAAELLVTQTLDSQTVRIAAVGAGLAGLKCILATQVGDSDSAAALPGVDGNGH